MSTGSRIKTAVFAACTVCILCVAGLQGQVETEKPDDTLQNMVFTDKTALSPRSLLLASNLTPEEVAKLEAVLQQDPNDLRSRSMLLAYYYYYKQPTDEIARNKRVQHALWFLENHPGTELLHTYLPHGNDEVVELWKQQLDKYPDNPQVIYEACNYFMVGYIDQAIECYQMGKSMDPENSLKWGGRLAQAYGFKMRESPEQDKQALAEASLRALEDAYANSKPLSFTRKAPGYPLGTSEFSNFEKAAMVPRMTKMALAAGDLDKAADYANWMLEEYDNNPYPWQYVYDGNYVLGMIAVQNGDMDGAGEYLLASSNIPVPPQVKNPFRPNISLPKELGNLRAVNVPTSQQGKNLFRPNMSLAKELLDRGERDVMLGFLKKCLNFWTDEYIPCSRWIQEMEAGETPDFSGHLNN